MSTPCGKAFLYFYNLVYLGFAALLVYLAVFFVKNWSSYTRVAVDLYAIVPAAIILGLSIIFFVAAIIGLYGTGRSNRCCLGVFFTFLLMIIILEILAGCLGYSYRNRISNSVKQDLTNSLHKYPLKDETFIRDAFNKMQSELHCCGVMGPNDWKNVTATGEIPKSCCRHPNSECGYIFIANVYQEGCFKKLSDYVKGSLNAIVGVGIGFAIFQAIGMIATCYLIFTLGKAGYTRIAEPQRV
ncbi:tetraspanin-3-like [Rhopilema esculentum]|uniref:tetraspanin-3-like n=1 Tax=Rhopilema esculentum TaxID=499914 RepID=UPI0031E25164